MRYVVTNGTGRKLSGASYKAYGKTGTAEYSSDKRESHSWFVGFAKKGKKKIAVAVVMEGAGAGSAYALPLAGRIFDTYLGE
jgi:peptidoglycan glycosyltransferase